MCLLILFQSSIDLEVILLLPYSIVFVCLFSSWFCSFALRLMSDLIREIWLFEFRAFGSLLFKWSWTYKTFCRTMWSVNFNIWVSSYSGFVDDCLGLKLIILNALFWGDYRQFCYTVPKFVSHRLVSMRKCHSKSYTKFLSPHNIWSYTTSLLLC